MKKFLCVMLASCLMLSLAACGGKEQDANQTPAQTEAQTEEPTKAVAGEYTGTATGMGALTVTATIDGTGKITALEIDASNETDSLGQVAAPKLQEKILEAGTIEGIDAISGCTVTSDAIFKAINDIYAQAGLVTE